MSRANALACHCAVKFRAGLEPIAQASAKVGRHGARDRTLILLAYRHALRVSELVTTRWEQIDLKTGLVMSRDSRPASPPRSRSAGPSCGAIIQSHRLYL